MSERISRILRESAERRRLLEEENFEELLESITSQLSLLTEAKGNAAVESAITKLRAAYRQNKLMTFREFLSVFASIINA